LSLHILSSYGSDPPRHLHSFPTRRSSDLLREGIELRLVRHEPRAPAPACVPAVTRLDPRRQPAPRHVLAGAILPRGTRPAARHQDRKSTRLNSSHRTISYAVFCLKKKNPV